ncbi:hypothetical protein THAOC_29606, partial [Thalassiosira oceanica]
MSEFRKHDRNTIAPRNCKNRLKASESDHVKGNMTVFAPSIILAVLVVLVALVQNLPTAAAVTIRRPTTSFTVAMPAEAGRRLWHVRISQNVADEAFSSLQAIYDGTGRSTGEKEQPRATKLGKNFEGAKLLFLTEARMGGVIEMLESFVKKSPTNSNTDKPDQTLRASNDQVES